MRSTEIQSRLAGLCLAALAQPSLAEVPMALDRVNLSLGGFYPVVDAHVSLSGPEFEGTPVDFKHNEALDNHRTLPNLQIELLVFDSQGFSIGGYQYSKSATATVSRDVDLEGTHIQIDGHADAGLRFYTYHAAWHWWLAPGEHDVLGLGVGAVYYDVKGTIDASLKIDKISLSARGAAEASAVAPLLTLAWRHAFSGNLRTYLDFSGVRKNSGTVTGHLVNATLGAEWYPFHNLGLALEYSSNALSLKAKKENVEGRASIDFHGPAAFVRLRY